MKDALKKFGEELAAELAARFQSPEVKQLVADTKAANDSDAGTFEVVITTENLDRYNEVIKLDGWELDNYLANPVVLWMHDHTQPIGVATSLQKKDGKLIAQGKFAPNAKGQEVRQLYDAGIVKAASVGFIPKEQEGNLITKAELLEFSFVSVPANPYALALAMEKSLNINELVTKGIMFVEKEAETVPESEAKCSECGGAADAPAEQQSAEHPICAACLKKGWSAITPDDVALLVGKQLAPVMEQLKAITVVLDALSSKTEELEDDEEAEAVSEEARGFEEFSRKRRVIQEAVTIFGDVLAEARQAIEARQ